MFQYSLDWLWCKGDVNYAQEEIWIGPVLGLRLRRIWAIDSTDPMIDVDNVAEIQQLRRARLFLIPFVYTCNSPSSLWRQPLQECKSDHCIITFRAGRWVERPYLPNPVSSSRSVLPKVIPVLVSSGPSGMGSHKEARHLCLMGVAGTLRSWYVS